MIRTLLFVFSLSLILPTYAQEERAPVYDFPPGRDGAQAIIDFLLYADEEERIELSSQLRPEKEDCDAVFTEEYARKVYRYQQRINKMARIVVQPLVEGQTDYLLWEATTQDLIDYKGEARFFPGGYKEIAAYLQPNFTFYRFKFIEPGHRLGSAYDMLVHVNGHWRLIHRPWVVMFD
ncbi:MAG: hypothetical protein AAFQ87_02280 [Bacteroidota bacterium]